MGIVDPRGETSGAFEQRDEVPVLNGKQDADGGVDRLESAPGQRAKAAREAGLADSFVEVAGIMQRHDATERVRLLNALASWWGVPRRVRDWDE